MTVSIIYRVALHLLPATLRFKHGDAMQTLFARELEHARARGSIRVAIVGALGIWDIVQRAIYELVRTDQLPADDLNDSHQSEQNRVTTHSRRSTLADLRAPQMKGIHMQSLEPQLPTTRQLLTRVAISFSAAFVALTSMLLGQYMLRRVQSMGANTPSLSAIVHEVVLALPFTAAMTIPMAAFVGVMYEFARLGKNGTLALARHERLGVRRLIWPIFVAAFGVAAIAFVVTAEIVPRSNSQLRAFRTAPNATTFRGSRELTIRELRVAERNVGQTNTPDQLAEVASYEVEVQKKFALPAACVIFALVAIALAFSMPRGGSWLVIGASLACFGAYYTAMMAGESLADQMVVSPFVGMWLANVFMIVAAMIAVSWRRVLTRNDGVNNIPLRT